MIEYVVGNYLVSIGRRQRNSLYRCLTDRIRYMLNLA